MSTNAQGDTHPALWSEQNGQTLTLNGWLPTAAFQGRQRLARRLGTTGLVFAVVALVMGALSVAMGIGPRWSVLLGPVAIVIGIFAKFQGTRSNVKTGTWAISLGAVALIGGVILINQLG